MKPIIAPLLLAALSLPGAAGAQGLRPGGEAAPRPIVVEGRHTVILCSPRDYPCRPWTPGERGRHDPSTLGIYQVRSAPPNDCGPSSFEVVNVGPREAPCVGIQPWRPFGR